MGSILTNGVFLPAEGERNCYTGLAANWRALDAHLGNTDIHVTYADKQAWNGHVADTTIHVTAADKEAWNGKADSSALTAHTGDTTIHVTAADKEAWNGKADASALTAHTGNTTIHVTAEDKEAWNGKAEASALTAHTGNTTIHVTAEDKAKWNAVTSKADDSDVVHRSGNETVGGAKTFSNGMVLNSLVHFTNTIVTKGTIPQSTVNPYRIYFGSGINYANSLFNIDTSVSNTGVQLLTLRSAENVVNGDDTRFVIVYNPSLTQPRYVSIKGDCVPSTDNTYECGSNDRKWKSFNGLNPGCLSMPNLSAGVDISGYLTNAGTTTPSEYTPTVDGWLVLAISADSPAFIRVFSTAGIDATAYAERNEIGSTSGGTYIRYASLTVPCRQNDKQNIIIMPSAMGIVKAMFYPCAGNA